MSKYARQSTELLRTAQTRKEISRSVHNIGFEATLREVGGYTADRFAERSLASNRVPVVVPAYNEGGPASDLPATLLALARSERAYPIVVDNRSTDDTTLIAERMGAVVVSAPKGRKMVATKAGIDYAHHELGAQQVLFTDADTLVMPRWAGAMSMSLAAADNGHGAALFGDSIKWHGPNAVVDTAITALNNVGAYRKQRHGHAPTARGHNFGIQFDADGAVEEGIMALPSDLFVEQGRVDDEEIARAVNGAGAAIVGSLDLDHYVLTRGDRVTTMRGVADLAMHRATYNQIVWPSYLAEYPDLQSPVQNV